MLLTLARFKEIEPGTLLWFDPVKFGKGLGVRTGLGISPDQTYATLHQEYDKPFIFLVLAAKIICSPNEERSSDRCCIDFLFEGHQYNRTWHLFDFELLLKDKYVMRLIDDK